MLLRPVLIVLCAVAAGCGRGGSDLCTLSTKCPGDSQLPIQSTLTGVSISDCNLNRKGPCGSDYESWLSCAWDKQTCKPDGTTDYDALNAACQAEFDKYFSCCAGADGGC
jgi:hypothetical protein